MTASVLICHVLVVFKDGVEVCHALDIQKTNRGDKIRCGSCSKSTTREAEEDDVIVIDIIDANEIVSFSNVLCSQSCQSGSPNEAYS